jgi:hypothetical protein
MVRMIFAAVAVAFGLQPAAGIARSKNADPMCWQAIGAGATRTRTSSPSLRNVGTPGNVAHARSRSNNYLQSGLGVARAGRWFDID